jgi:uncharacterized membrane protein (DUF485 family)
MPPIPPEHAPAHFRSRSSRIGLVFFGVYLLVYGLFVVLNAFFPEVMETTPLAGVNLAVLYGLGLIVFAFVLALAYAWICRSDAEAKE